jgi:hypothetical protein
MLSAIYKPFMLSVVKLNVILLSVIMRSVVAPARLVLATALPLNIRLGRKWQKVTQILAYDCKNINYDRKKIYDTGPGVDV